MPDDDRYNDPASTRLPSPGRPSPTPRRSGWVADPDEPSGWRWMPDLTDLSAVTGILPVIPLGKVDFQGAVDWAWPPDDYDTGDLIDPNAPDPTPDEITDPDHPDHVDPWTPE